MCGFSHTCVVFTKHFDMSQVFGRNHTCVVFTTHMEVHVISGNSHTCVVFLKQLEWCLKTHGHIHFEHMEISFSTKILFLQKFCFWCRNMQFFYILRLINRFYIHHQHRNGYFNKETLLWLKRIKWKDMSQENLIEEADSFFGAIKTKRHDLAATQ